MTHTGKQRALVQKWRKAANEATTADAAVTYGECADDLELTLAEKVLTAICEGCGLKVKRPPTSNRAKVYPDLPYGWSQTGTSKYRLAGHGPRLAAWCPSCRAQKAVSPVSPAQGEPQKT